MKDLMVLERRCPMAVSWEVSRSTGIGAPLLCYGPPNPEGNPNLNANATPIWQRILVAGYGSRHSTCHKFGMALP